MPTTICAERIRKAGSALSSGLLIRDMGPMLQGNSLVVDAQDIRQLLSEMARDYKIRDLQRRLTGEDAKTESGRRKIESSVAQHRICCHPSILCLLWVTAG
jgi:hypothetical protein